MPDISIIVAVYNEEDNIPLLYGRIISSLRFCDVSWELIFVNDGSWDHSSLVLNHLANKNSRVKIINLTRNFGQQAALTAGMDYASGKAIITMDADLQDPPELIPEMIKMWKRGIPVVFARRNPCKDSLFKRMFVKIYYYILRQYLGFKITGDFGDFRLIDYKVLSHISKMKEKSRYLRDLVDWLGFKYEIIDYLRPKRIHGKTSYSLLKTARLVMDGILLFSLLPLKIGMIIGLLNILAGFFFLLYILFQIIFNNQYYPLYKWLILVLFIVIGFLFILVWILAEYVGRIYEEKKSRPLYVVNDLININNINT